jgi:hypothetical protein
MRARTGLGADAADLGARAVAHLLGERAEVDPPLEAHLARVDAEDRDASLRPRRRELDLAIDAAWPKEGRVEDVYAVGGHDDLAAKERSKRQSATR